MTEVDGATGEMRVLGSELDTARTALESTIAAINDFYNDWENGQSTCGGGATEDRRTRYGRMTTQRLFALCYPKGTEAPCQPDYFEKLLRGKQRPKTLTSIEQVHRLLDTGLRRAEATFDPNHGLYENLARISGRGAAAREGFRDYIGAYRTVRLDANDALITGRLELLLHPRGLDPHFQHEHSQTIDGNVHTFRYEGPVMMMPSTVELIGMRVGHDGQPACEIRPCKLARGDPASNYLTGDFVSQQHETNITFARRVVLYRDDLWMRAPPTDRFLLNLLRAPVKRRAR